MTKEDNYFYQIILILGRKFIKSKKNAAFIDILHEYNKNHSNC